MATSHVKIKDSDVKDSEDDGDDSDQEINPTTNTQKKKSKKETPRKKKKGRRNPVLRRGRIPGEAARVVLDGGTEFEVIGRVGWRVLEKVSKSAKLHGWAYPPNCQCSHCL